MMQTHTKPPPNCSLAKPFDGHSKEYLSWRKHRLDLQEKVQQQSAGTLALALSPTLNQATDEKALINLCQQVEDYGFGIYQWTTPSSDTNTDLLRLHNRLSLYSTDKNVLKGSNGLSTLRDLTGTAKGRFIPYTAKSMGWHSDGYYNDKANSLRSFTLHCVEPAAQGGALSLIDDRLVLIAMYDTDPQLVALLTNQQAMTLPGNKDNLGHNRPDQHSPVFFNRPDNTPGTHFTTRTTNITWRNKHTQSAAEQMSQLIEQHKDWQYTIRLEAGQGIITRNILHRREAFTDNPERPPRQMIRGRYLQAPQPAPVTPEV